MLIFYIANFLKDPAWISIIISLITAGYIYYLQRNVKELVYEIAYQALLATKNDNINDKMNDFFKDGTVQSIYITVIILKNIGNISVTAQDYERPITILFKDSKILSATITKCLPKTLKPSIQLEDSSIKMIPVLLNKRDSVEFQIISNNEHVKNIFFDYRINGVEEIKDITAAVKSKFTIEKYYILTSMIIAPIWFAIYGFFGFNILNVYDLLTIIFFVGAYFVLLGVMIPWLKHRKASRKYKHAP